MMTITGTTKNGSLLLQTSDPLGGKKQTMIAHTPDAALRVAYFWYRLYICEKLIAWVHQRLYALQYCNNADLLSAANRLVGILEDHKKASLDAIATKVYMERDLIAFIAPGENSNHYKIYQHIVLPIIAFCKEISEGHILTISKSE